MIVTPSDHPQPQTAQEWLDLAVGANILGHDNDMSTYEQAARECRDYRDELMLSSLLDAAQRHADFGNEDRLRATMERARRYSKVNLHCELLYLIGEGNVLCWQGRIPEGLNALRNAIMALESLKGNPYPDLLDKANRHIALHSRALTA
jgi:hypothetical protein